MLPSVGHPNDNLVVRTLVLRKASCMKQHKITYCSRASGRRPFDLRVTETPKEKVALTGTASRYNTPRSSAPLCLLSTGDVGESPTCTRVLQAGTYRSRTGNWTRSYRVQCETGSGRDHPSGLAKCAPDLQRHCVAMLGPLGALWGRV